MKMSSAHWILPLTLMPLVSCVQTSSTNSNHLSFSTDQTVMLHWLEVDPEGVVREAETDGNTTKHKEPFSGKAIETFEQSPTKSISTWKNGKRHGTTLEYFYNGRKRTSIVYKNGQRHGPSREYRITGELWREETYKEDQLTGPKSEWYPNGVKSFQVQMRNGIAHGDAKEWYNDGTEKSSTIYRHGLREGPSSEWYPSGQQKLGLFYQKDKQHGQRTIWYENGKKRLSAQFIDDSMEGNSKGWFPSGQQQFDYNFKNNLEHGVCTEWDESGTKISEIRFDNGVPTQDLLTGQRIAAQSSEPSSGPEEDNSGPQSVAPKPVPSEKEDLPPLPEEESIPSATKPVKQVEEAPKSTPKAKRNPKPKEINPPAGPESIPAIIPESVPAPKVESVEKETNGAEPLDSNIPPPPPELPVPGFDPFSNSNEDSNRDDSVPVPNLPEDSFVPPPPPSLEGEPDIPENPFSTSEPVSNPPSFDPFAEDNSPAANPFETSPDSSTVNPFEEPNAPAPSFDPFSADAQPESIQGEGNEEAEVPLGDVFGDPPPSNDSESFPGLPEAPPPPPTFNPFEN